MKSELDGKIEMTKRLKTFCYTIRRGRNAAELAPFAAEREIQYDRELKELEAQKALLETPELALAGSKAA